MRDIEIYLPCDPDWFCDGLLTVFMAIFGVALTIFIVMLFREYKKLYPRQKPNKNRSRGHSNNKRH
ncbi:conserved protein of unknown function [Vibrio tapetis subsp. tapetis]|uniref:Uncharacterized protein n=1 Tax=Vibrio tapetis subsp. tapetis TaxID=1671868 RepID=A0A2N8Z9E1_9VIBR|nr:conserved protein of unknown function [Vibrio tapetis subsp. tapetis]